MISSSFYWRKELRLILERIQKFQRLKRIRESSQQALEKDFVLLFFIIRKLEQAGELSSRYKGKSYKLDQVSRTNSDITFRNWHRIELHYDFATTLLTTMNLKNIADTVIHSIYCFPMFDVQKRLSGICFASENSGKALFILEIELLLRAITEIAFGEIVVWRSKQSEDGSTKYLRLSNFDLVEMGVSKFKEELQFEIENWDEKKLEQAISEFDWTKNSVL